MVLASVIGCGAAATHGPVVDAPAPTAPVASAVALADMTAFVRAQGRWQGEWTRLDPAGNVTERFSSVLTQRIDGDTWAQQNSYTYADGSKRTREFVGTNLGNGAVEFVNPANEGYWDYTAIARQHSDSIIVYEVVHKQTGAIAYVETISLIGADRRVRVGQHYAPDGTYKGSIIVLERRL